MRIFLFETFGGLDRDCFVVAIRAWMAIDRDLIAGASGFLYLAVRTFKRTAPKLVYFRDQSFRPPLRDCATHLGRLRIQGRTAPSPWQILGQQRSFLVSASICRDHQCIYYLAPGRLVVGSFRCEPGFRWCCPAGAG
jgi:hypothetical protein